MKPWTVGDLRRAIDGVPDSLVVNVNVTCHSTHGSVDGFFPLWIESGGIGMSNVGGDEAPEPYSYFELETMTDESSLVLLINLPRGEDADGG